MNKILTTSLTLSVLALTALNAQTLLQDTFNADLGGTNPNTDVNLDAVTRQSGGSATTTYTENGNTDSFLNIPGGGAFAGETALLLRTSSTGGASASNAGVTTNTNFATSLVGQVYRVEVTGLIQTAGAPSADYWGSFFLTDSSTATAPNAAGTDYGILFRERDTNNVTLWEDSTGTTSTVANGGTSPFDANTAFTLSILIDEVNGTVDTIINQGSPSEVTVTQATIDFENGSDRYFGFRANQGSATGLADIRFDNFTVSLVPEQSSYALLSGLMGLSAVFFIRRRS
jgi:hypothetical protein